MVERRKENSWAVNGSKWITEVEDGKYKIDDPYHCSLDQLIALRDCINAVVDDTRKAVIAERAS